jgi:hypothetical protein
LTLTDLRLVFAQLPQAGRAVVVVARVSLACRVSRVAAAGTGCAKMRVCPK